MQSNLNNRVFNPNDHTSWRWNDPVLANTPISEAEARQITQIARHLGGEFSFLSRTSNPDILTAVTNHNLPEAQQLIARRAAIIVTAQMKNGIPVRDASKVDIHHQINTFFEGLPEDLKIEEEQKTLIHKTIDSYFTAKEFRVGRRKLNSYDAFPKNTQNRPEMTKANLLKFFHYMIADIPSEVAQDSYNPLAPVTTIMTHNPKSGTSTASVAELLDVMESKAITVLPIVDNELRLVGLLHLHDLLGKGEFRFSG